MSGHISGPPAYQPCPIPERTFFHQDDIIIGAVALMNDDEDAHDEEIDGGEEIWWYLAEDKGLGPGLPPDIGLDPRWPRLKVSKGHFNVWWPSVARVPIQKWLMEKLIKIFQLLFGGYLDLEDIGTQIKVSKMRGGRQFLKQKFFLSNLVIRNLWIIIWPQFCSPSDRKQQI